MINIGLLGCAHIHTPGFVKNILGRSNVRLKSTWDPNPARSRKYAGDAGASAVATADAILSDPDISAVIICSETNRHQELVSAAARAGKHMFVEKPLGMGAADSYAMAKAIKAAKVKFSTGYFMRGAPIHLFLKEQIEKGLFGKVTRVRGSNCHSGAIGDWFAARPETPADDWRWMADPAVAGVGAFGDLGTHSLDILIWLMGEVESVTASVGTGIQRYANKGSFCDETGEGMIRFKNGAIGTLAAAWDDLANPVTLLVSGTEAHAVVIDGKLYLKSTKLNLKGDEPFSDLPLARPAGMDAFLDAVAGDATATLVSVEEAAYRPAVMEAMYEGARTNRWVLPAA